MPRRAEIEAAAADGARDPDGAPLYPGLYKRRDAARDRAAAGRRRTVRAAHRHGGSDRRRGRQARRAPLLFTELAEDGTPHTIEARPERWGDAVIVRKDMPASYHLAVVVDDAWQGVTHVTRGRDLYRGDRPAPPAAGAARPAGARSTITTG